MFGFNIVRPKSVRSSLLFFSSWNNRFSWIKCVPPAECGTFCLAKALVSWELGRQKPLPAPLQRPVTAYFLWQPLSTTCAQTEGPQPRTSVLVDSFINSFDPSGLPPSVPPFVCWGYNYPLRWWRGRDPGDRLCWHRDQGHAHHQPIHIRWQATSCHVCGEPYLQ